MTPSACSPRARRRPHASRLAARPGRRGSARRRSPIASRVRRSPRRMSATHRDAVSLSAKTTSAARQVRALSHPGLLVIRRPYDEKAKRFATGIPVDEVRRLRSFLAHRAVADGWRVVIVDEANELNVNAANALLKSLEEPPARTVFLLVSSAPGRLVPTIRSRCRTLTLQPLDAEALRAATTQALGASETLAPGAAEWAPLERLAEGSVGHLLGLLGSGGIELQERVAKLLALLPRSTGAPCTRFPTSCNPSPRRPASSCSSSSCSNACRASFALPPRARGLPRTVSWLPASSAMRGLPRSPPCGKELAAKRPIRWRSTSTARASILETVARLAAAAQDRKARLTDARAAPDRNRTTAPRPNVRRKGRPHAGNSRPCTQHLIRGPSVHERAPEILHHHGDLLSQRRAAHRPRLRGDRHRRHRALRAARRQGRVLPHRHRRARPQDEADGRQGGPDAARACRPQYQAFSRDGRAARPVQRRLHPHHRAASLPRIGRDLAAHGEGGRHLPQELRRLVLGARRGLLQRERDRSRRRQVRRGPQGTPVEWTEEETYFFKLSAYQDKLLAHYDAESRLHPAAGAPQRGHELRQRRP